MSFRLGCWVAGDDHVAAFTHLVGEGVERGDDAFLHSGVAVGAEQLAGLVERG